MLEDFDIKAVKDVTKSNNSVGGEGSNVHGKRGADSVDPINKVQEQEGYAVKRLNEMRERSLQNGGGQGFSRR
jgi:hypothetical protein